MSIFRAYDIRGIYGKDLTEEIMTSIGEAAGTLCPGAFTIGRDFREHGAQLEVSLGFLLKYFCRV
jgi:phosphomannomutase